MAGVNQFLPFAVGTGANVLTPSAYAALTTLVAQGFQSGIAPSQQVNTPLRQATFVSSALAQIIADAGINANDDGDLTTFKNNFTQVVAMPRGGVMMWPVSTPPTGFLSLNGAAISRTTYAFLFGLFGTAFGSGDGSTTFNLPDARNRAPVGAGSLYSVAATGGSKDAIVVSHTHGVSDSGHSHSTYIQTQIGGTSSGPDANWWRKDASTTGTSTTGISINSAGSSGTDANMMPYLAVNFVIKY